MFLTAAVLKTVESYPGMYSFIDVNAIKEIVEIIIIIAIKETKRKMFSLLNL